jgi:predicted proteasome-type protease
MQKSLLITIVLILLVQGLVHGQSNDEEQDSAKKIVKLLLLKVDQKFETVNETWSEQLANVLERLDRIESCCQNNDKSVPSMY